jgi:septum formation protein
MLILASTSPRRRALLKKMGVSFRVKKPAYQEDHFILLSPSRLVCKHALSKALSVAQNLNAGTVLGADTIVFCKGRILGKPANLNEAQKTLALLQGRWHTVYTGVAIVEARNKKVAKTAYFYEKTRVRLRRMDRVKIKDYFRAVNPLDKAGAYAIQSRSLSIVEKIEGSFSNAMGLPVERLAALGYGR